LNRRRFVLGASAGVAAATLAGCDMSFRQGVFNSCAPALPAALLQQPLLAAAWHGIDPKEVWDSHVHVFGSGDSGSGAWFNPRMEKIWRAQQYVQRKMYINAGCVDDQPGRVDASMTARLMAQCDAMPPGFHAILLAFDWARDEAGTIMQEQSTFYVPDAWAAALAARHPQRLAWAASIHPYDPAALDRLNKVAALGACAVKWLPTAQGMDPASPRCDRFYARMAALRLPLISHAGDERAVTGFTDALGNPLRLRRPLDAGVRVVVAHCASLGMGHDLDQPDGAMTSNFSLFARLMDTPKYNGLVSGDISAVTQGNRMEVLGALLARPDWSARLLNGSDYPLPAIVPLTSLPALVDRGLLPADAVEPLRQLREHNALMFDFVLKRSLSYRGAAFAPEVFATRQFFTVPHER